MKVLPLKILFLNFILMLENRLMGNTKLKESRPSKETTKENLGYPKFKEIDGSHPLKSSVPEAVVEYQVRTRHGGQVAFFNFELARELGLIPEGHSHELTKELKEEMKALKREMDFYKKLIDKS